ncbi:UNVERIFIED_CONTAM: type VII secretion system (Wss) protein ESAT-6 [Acetivibrio alkalicellulosi]
MSSIISTISNICDGLEDETKSIRNKKNKADKVWKGTAKDVFDEKHKDMEAHMKDVLNRLHKANSTVRNLNNSIVEAEQIKKAKKNK